MTRLVYYSLVYALTSFISPFINDSIGTFILSYVLISALFWPLKKVYPIVSLDDKDYLLLFLVSVISWVFGWMLMMMLRSKHSNV